MRRLLVAIRAFFRVLLDRRLAEDVGQLLEGRSNQGPDGAGQKPVSDAPRQVPTPPPVTERSGPAPEPRSEALTLLAALQREARLVDFFMEPIDTYSDSQIGAAARQVHQHAAQVLQRLFQLQPVAGRPEGETIEVPSTFDAQRYRLTGNVSGQGPYQGRLIHRGWEAAHCELPQWTGSPESAQVVAPAEVNIG